MNRELIELIDKVEKQFLSDMTVPDGIVIPKCLAESLLGVLKETWAARAQLGGVAGRAQACAIFLDQCIEAQVNP